MTGKKRIGLLGGSFNPIHIGHLIMAENAMEQLGLDLVHFAPAGNPPHKTGQRLAPIADRIAMIHLAIADRPMFECSPIDSDHGEPSYTWRLLERLHEQEPDAGIAFIMGGDSLRDFRSWSRPERILELAELAVVERPGVSIPDDMLELPPVRRNRVHFVETPMCSISSTEIRARVKASNTIRYLVPEDVRRYIESNGLYQ